MSGRPSPPSARATAAAVLCAIVAASSARADDPFRERIVPFVKAHCVECHNATTHEAELNLTRYDSAESAADDFRQWEHVITFVQREEMPPASAKKQPSPEQRAEFLKTLRMVLAAEAKKVAGDPGVVLPRRLSNAEYDYTVRDLTGVDIHPTKAFPVDPAAGEGFNNTGEALAMSPALFAKLYAAAQHVADHAMMTTAGIEFAPFPVVTFADRRKFYEQAITGFYDAHAVNYEKVLGACWEYRYRPAAQKDATIEGLAKERGLSPKYVRGVFELLWSGDEKVDASYLGWLRRRWNAIPGPTDAANPMMSGEARNAIAALARDVQSLAVAIAPRETEAIVAHAGNAPIDHLARRRKTAGERNTFDKGVLQPMHRVHHEFRGLDKQSSVVVRITVAPVGDAKPDDGYVILKSLAFSHQPPNNYRPNDDKQNLPLRKLLEEHAPDQLARLKFGTHPQGDAVDPNAVVLAASSTLEFEAPVKAWGDKREMRFYAEAELDRAHTASGVLAIDVQDGKSPRAKEDAKSADPFGTAASPGRATLLVDPSKPVAEQLAASGAAFSRLFPNRFFFADETRGLSAGFHLIEGFFRDDRPLCELVLSDDENRELNRLWNELEFVTEISERMLRGFVFFERSERNFLKHTDFDPFKEEDPKLVERETLDQFEKVYLARAGVKAPIDELKDHPIHIFFEQTRDGLAARKERLSKAEPIYLRDVERFAGAAYRRPLTAQELEGLRAFYHRTAAQSEYGIEQAVRASLVRILVSLHFGVRLDTPSEGDTIAPLSDLALASRLSYFLWSSMPDAELRAVAESGKLRDPNVLLEQTRRMLKDPKVSDFAREFLGQWLGYRDFNEQESVDRNTFKEFDDSLRQSMFEEPTRLAAWLIQNDRPVTDLLDSDTTFVDKRLAKHYGVPFPGKDGDWELVTGLRSQGRGGVLGMAVFLTKNSQPQRPSPVKRGFWVVHKILGEHIPAPPADVVALPAKETDTNGKTIRQLLAMHVEDAKCARCHVRFDAAGLAMEGFDSIGRRRTKDLAGRAIDDLVKLPDGSESRGVPEFARHLARDRRTDFVRTFNRKLLGYALGRSLQLSDDVLLDEMQAILEKNGDRMVPLFETIVLSPQFRNQRCREFTTAAFRRQNSK